MSMGEDYVAAMNPTSNTNSVLFCTNIGIGITIMTFVCNELGSRNVSRAEIYFSAGFLFAFSVLAF